MLRELLTPELRRTAVVAAGLVAGLAAVSAAWAMRVSPMVAELTTSGAGSAARIEVGNIGAAAMPFETRITRIDYDADGNLVETDQDEDFLVFPPQGLVPVNGRQVVRVQWVGEGELDTSRAYYLAVRQLPVQTDVNAQPESGGAISVSVLYTMKALIVVAPPGAKADVKVESVTPIMVEAPAPQIDPSLAGEGPPPTPPATPGVEVTVTNSGKRYALMSGATWVIEGTQTDGQPFRKEMTGQDVGAAVGVGYLAPAGGKRTFKLPLGVALDPDKPISVRFTR
ncbi:fimbria/pilus periplasmic chaperone [Brevundimonas albigilva]|uniref:fimbria/pilus periplasmic chaperone n=1 Tax=Brevundimonas albigilva TaxID=1312364 RepID=UPI00201B4D97|nr:fimbria/pilus periplasmic chaperone [Brevundimonas albigilva]UQV17112.1 fimbria/pilus periplasmic chaperone [Brevundimonas albigilva]